MKSLAELKQRADERSVSYASDATLSELLALLLPSPSDTSIDAKIERDWLFGGQVDVTHLSPDKTKPLSKPPCIKQARKRTRAATMQHALSLA